MDTSSRRFVWEMMKNNKLNRIIILTTHFMDEADFLGDRIAIMSSGELKCCGSALFLKNKFGIGYNLIIVKKKAEKNQRIIDFVTGYIPESQILSDVSAEISFQLPLNSLGVFKDLFKEMDKRF
jgi:ATP-binding cassette subfamily A (ABC1) protein 3